MPHVINGIGTWYYGKRNVHRLRNLCTQCGAVNDLESYDTTLYFVVFFVPLISIGSKRILDMCPACNRHRMIPLRQWHRLKSESIAGVLEKLKADPDDRAHILEAIAVAASFQDEALFERMSEALANDRTDDAEIQAALGEVYGYFARHGEAAGAFMNSLRAAENPRVREQLGITLLRLGDPEQAEGCFRHVLEEADQERLWMLYQLTVAYQAKGLHAEALAVLDRIREKFPATADVKDWQKLRTISEKDGGRNRPVGRSPLEEGKHAGTREGNRLGWLLPRLVLPLLLLAFAGWHTWRSVTLASARPMYLVNGTNKQYSVAVNERSFQLPPGVVLPVELPEGPLALAPAEGAEGIVDPAVVSYESSFWSRPYDSTRVVINPDRLAVLVKEYTTYAEPPIPPDHPDEYRAGKPLHVFAGIDHCFEPFPHSIESRKRSVVKRTRLGLAEAATSEARIGNLIATGLSPEEQIDYVKRWVLADPDDSIALAWFCATAPTNITLPFLKAGLGRRPVCVEWHRAYQTMAERAGIPNEMLRAEYGKLADEFGRDPDALYLLARVSDREASLELLNEAVRSGRPAERAHFALCYRYLCEGNYAAAAEQAGEFPGLIKSGGLSYRPVAMDALLAAKRYPDVLRLLADDQKGVAAVVARVRVYELAGEPAEADATAQALLNQIPPQTEGALRKSVEASIRAVRAAARGDAPGYLNAAESSEFSGSAANCLLRGDLTGAEAAIVADAANDAEIRALLLLATPPADAEKWAAAKKAFLESLDTPDREKKLFRNLLERGSNEPVQTIREILILPDQKRVFAAAASAWFPEHKAELSALSRELDFHRDVVSLVLAKSH